MIDGNNDLKESFAEQTDYLRHVGVSVLKTSIMDKTPREIFEPYKKAQDYRSLYQLDYYITQGPRFIMIFSVLILTEFEDVIKGKSARGCLLYARMIKLFKSLNPKLAVEIK